MASKPSATAKSNGNMRRAPPDTVVRWLNKLADTGNIVNGYRVDRIYQGYLYGEPYQHFFLIEV